MCNYSSAHLHLSALNVCDPVSLSLQQTNRPLPLTGRQWISPTRHGAERVSPQSSKKCETKENVNRCIYSHASNQGWNISETERTDCYSYRCALFVMPVNQIESGTSIHPSIHERMDGWSLQSAWVCVDSVDGPAAWTHRRSSNWVSAVSACQHVPLLPCFNLLLLTCFPVCMLNVAASYLLVLAGEERLVYLTTED